MNKIAQVVQEGRFVNVYLNGKDITKEVPQPVRLKARNAGKDVELLPNGEWIVSGSDSQKQAVSQVQEPALEEAPAMALLKSDSVRSEEHTSEL